jgi:hypothetical protein
MLAGMNGVQANDFTRKVKAQNLLLAFVVDDVALEATGPDRSYAAEFITRTKQVLTRLNGSGTVNDLFEPLGLIGR